MNEERVMTESGSFGTPGDREVLMNTFDVVTVGSGGRPVTSDRAGRPSVVS
jgi:hypothetical protein